MENANVGDPAVFTYFVGLPGSSPDLKPSHNSHIE
jgi:hypothetical protein